MKYLYSYLFVFAFLASCNKEKTNTVQKEALFVALDSSQTGITFKNILKPTKSLNIIDFTYFYNGGGVATADFNNDGFDDVFFVSNQNENQLYLNKGHLTFENITKKAGVGGKSDWNTGVTIVDINSDGFMDIYVCSVSNFNGLKGKNELFINNGDLTFTEKAADYGLDFETYATHASFFDYDHDGDLDCYLLNYALQESENYVPVNQGRVHNSLSGDYLLRNDNGKFIDVSKKSGIYQSKIGFGLSVSVADLNNDGWEDIYVANDFHEDDYFYVNQKDGTFLEKGRDFFSHFSRFSMGSDIADINNDGYFDIMNLDMYPEQRLIEKMSVGEDPFDIYSYKLSYGYYPQYAKNSLQLNNQGKGFSDISSYSGVAATDWSWSALFADFDNDGIKDLFVSNGIPKRPNDLDFISFVSNYQNRNAADINLDQYYEEAIGKMPEGSYHDFIYKGTTSLKFIDKSMTWGFDKPTVSNGTVYTDLDNDGDLDLVVNRLNDQMGIYENKANTLLKNNYLQLVLKGDNKNKHAIGTKVEIFSNGKKQMQQLMNSRGFQSAVGNTVSFGLGKDRLIDSLKIYWNTGEVKTLKSIKVNQKLIVDKTDSKQLKSNNKLVSSYFKEIESPIAFIHKENAFTDFNREVLIPFKISSEGPALAIGDVNKDGLEDAFFGGARNQSGELWVQGIGGKFKKSKIEDFEKDNILEQVDAAFFDADKDGDLDLYVVVAGNEFYGDMPNQQDCLYINDGKGNFIKALKNLPKMLMNTSCVRPCDFDKDGDIDLFVGGRVVSNSYGLVPQSFLLENDGKGIFKDVTKQKAKGLAFSGMITDATWQDIDGDKDLDLITVAEWSDIKIFKNEKSHFVNYSFTTNPTSGLWHSVQASDYDNDGDIDFIAGNLGLNTKFYRNNKQDLRMYVKDFDNNGSVEQIVAFKENGKWYPIEGRDELGKSLPGIIKKRFASHKDFASKSIEEIFTKEELDNCIIYKVNTLESLYYENKGNGMFNAHRLPKEVNYSTVFSIFKLPNTSERNQVLMAGNYLGVNTWQSPYDASYGLALNFDTSKKIKTINDSGFFVKGEVRKMKSITINNKPHIVVAKNNGKPQFFKILN
ncbi:MAG: VCBS repeat-containing protein [Bacteroidia bacterium]|jgi:hypothetical protein|nr:VCBS repeat-containing protein [Bacteroidia bacterium]